MKHLNQLPRMEIESTPKAINGFLGSISLENRVIFIRRYWFCDTYAEIAERYGICERKVKRQIHATREQLSNYLGGVESTFGINNVDARFVREAESVTTLRGEKRYRYQSNIILIDLVNFVFGRFLSFPKHA